jgi:hypothetical protein
MNARRVKRAVKIGVTAVVAVAVFGYVVMSLWNWLAPAVFGLRTITFWQALGVLILSKVLFGGFRTTRPGFGGYAWHRVNNRWQQMTPEEREQFRQGMFTRCNRTKAAAEGSPDPRQA